MSDNEGSCGGCRHYKATNKDRSKGVCMVPSRAHAKEPVEEDTYGCSMYAESREGFKKRIRFEASPEGTDKRRSQI